MKAPLILWGGVDISPSYYEEEPWPQTQHPIPQKDEREFHQARYAVANNIPIIGICRGAQLLCVLNGGKLVQHSEPHKQNHHIQCKNQPEPFTNVSASHHQIMIPSGNYEILGWNPQTTQIWTSPTRSHMENNCPEIIWWPETKCLGIQAHPEWANESEPWLIYIDNLIKELGINYQFRNRKAETWYQ